ncbi:hypothetical protein D047_3681, partial [Vibrio parahaemolyticus VPTS-2010_2]
LYFLFELIYELTDT